MINQKSWKVSSDSIDLILIIFLQTDVSVQFSSVTQSCPIPCDPMDCSMPGFPVHNQLLELAQPHVHQAGDTIQPSHPLSLSSPPALNLSQHQGLFQWVNSLHQVAKCSFSISPSHEYSGLIFFMIDWFYLLAVQGDQISTPILSFSYIGNKQSLGRCLQGIFQSNYN